MKRTKTKTQITIEQRHRTTVRLRPREAWCVDCAAQSQMISTDEAAWLLQTTARALFRRVEAGELHFRETEGGALLICRASLEKRC